MFSASSADLVCPSGLNCYMQLSDHNAYDFTTSEQTCRDLGAAMVNIETEEEYIAIVQWLLVKGKVHARSHMGSQNCSHMGS